MRRLPTALMLLLLCMTTPAVATSAHVTTLRFSNTAPEVGS